MLEITEAQKNKDIHINELNSDNLMTLRQDKGPT